MIMNWQNKIAEQVSSIPRSGIREFFDLVTGRTDIISLGVGEPDFVTPWNIREAAIYSLEKGHTSYTSNYGLESLRRSIVKYVDGFFHVNYDPLQEIARICIKHDLIVLTDEIYSELRYDGKPHVSIASLPGMKERTLLLHGFSKAFAMTGFRLGYACGPEPLISAMMKIHQYSMLCAPITSQEAAIEALENGTSAMLKMRESYRQRRDYLVKRLNEIGMDCHLPGGAF